MTIPENSCGGIMGNKKVFVARYLTAIFVAQIGAVLIGLTGYFVFAAHWFEASLMPFFIACFHLWMWRCWMPVSKDESLWMQEAMAGGMLLLFLLFCPESWLWFALLHFTSMPVWVAKLVSIGLAGVVGIGWFAFGRSKSKRFKVSIRQCDQQEPQEDFEARK